MALPAHNALAASAAIVFPRRQTSPKYDSWQDQVWTYFDTVEEFCYGVTWMANAVSRVRLLAAELVPGGDEPTPLEDGPAADLVARLAGGTGGQSQLMKASSIHLSVPGEFWLVGEAPDPAQVMFSGTETWTVKSADELRVSPRKSGRAGVYQVREGDKNTDWRDLNPDSLVVRCWSPHTRWGWKADSPARHSLGALFELDMVNKRIVATTMSRLASNGILLYDRSRLSVPTRTSPGEADVDPFAAMLVDIAARGIADPASAEATIPIPIGYQIDDLTGVDPKTLMQVIRMDNEVSPQLLAQRDSALRRLATGMDIPAEIVLGMGDANHWTAWQLEESAIKLHVSPGAELICHCYTTGYLTPALEAAGEDTIGPNGGRLIVWYDPSEITARPDQSGNAVLGYDRLEVSGRALRRELGVEEADAPTAGELAAMALKRAALIPALSASALSALGGPALTPDIAGAGGGPAVALPSAARPAGGNGQGPPQRTPPPNAAMVTVTTNGAPAGSNGTG